MTAITIWATVPNLMEVCRTSTSWAVSSWGGSQSGASGWGVQAGGEVASPGEGDEPGSFVFGIELCRVPPSLIVRGPIAQFHTALQVIREERDGRDTSETRRLEALQNSLYRQAAFMRRRVTQGELSLLSAALFARAKFSG